MEKGEGDMRSEFFSTVVELAEKVACFCLPSCIEIYAFLAA